MKHIVHVSEPQWQSVVTHVLPAASDLESAAFLLARPSVDDDRRHLTAIELVLAQGQDFVHQYDDYLELTDEARILLQKKAIALEAAIIEVHSHPRQPVAEFSVADLLGFEETVPQMRWRLGDRPYAAIVMTPTSFDALVWWDETGPDAIDAVHLGHRRLQPTGRTLESAYG